jgi:hypothetical protein
MRSIIGSRGEAPTVGAGRTEAPAAGCGGRVAPACGYETKGHTTYNP